ncbi:hypothetical protein FOWG_18067, partial [Fusarium oxysporum f. sp. lycopersici MN25]
QATRRYNNDPEVLDRNRRERRPSFYLWARISLIDSPSTPLQWWKFSLATASQLATCVRQSKSSTSKQFLSRAPLPEL